MTLDESLHITDDRIRAVSDPEEVHQMTGNTFYHSQGHGVLPKDSCPACRKGRLRYRSSRSYGNPDEGRYEAWSLYECDHCGWIDERDVS